MESLEDLLWIAHSDGGEIHPRPEDWYPVRARFEAAWASRLPEIVAGWRQAKVHGSTVTAAEQRLAPLLACVQGAASDLELALALAKLDLASLLKAAEHPGQVGISRTFGDWLQAFSASAPTAEAVLARAFLPSIQDEMDRRCREEGLFTFSRMIQGVVDALGSEDLVRRLARRFDLVLVDEFQDTDPRQWEIFHRVFAASGRMILIGDPKQAIYGFRGGDLPTYQRACADLLQGQPPARLEQNHRSTPDMIEAHNELLLGPGREDSTAFFSDPGLYRSPILCGNPALEARAGDARIPPVDLFRVDKASGARLWRRAALALARHLKHLKEAGIRFGENLGRAGETGRRLGYGDMQILVGKASEGELLARTLRAEGVPCAFYKQKGLFSTREVEEWLDVLRAVDAPRDRSRQAPAFLSRFFGCTLEDLAGLPELPEDHPASVRLLEWNALARQHRYPELVTALLEGSGLTRRLLLCEEGLRALVNFRHVGELLLEAATRETVRLEDLVRRLEGWRSGTEAPPSEEGDLQRLEGEEEAVQILTLHAAKGLQAPIVAIFAFGKGRTTSAHRFHAGGKRCLHLGPLPPGRAGLKELVAREADEERQRLLYVAMTRAQAKLVLFAFEERRTDKTFKLLEGAYEVLNRVLLARGPEGLPSALFEVMDLPFVRLEALAETPPPDLAALRLPSLPVPDLPDYASLRFRARPRVTTSYTALQHQLEEAFRGPRPQGLPSAPDPLPGGAHVGQALHELLAWADLGLVRETAGGTWTRQPGVQAAIEAALDLHGIPGRCAERVGQLVHTALSAPLPLGPSGGSLRVCGAARCLRETDFLTRWLEPDRSPERDLLNGSIDLLCEQDGRAYLLDWKSNRLPDYTFASLDACVQASYLLQARIYLKASLAFLDIRDEADYERRFGGILYVFLRGLPEGGTWFHRPSWPEAIAWQQDLERLHQEVIHA